MRKYDFPAIHVTDHTLHMNPGATGYFKDAQALRLRAKGNLLLIEPAPKYGANAFALKHKGGCAMMSLPNELRARNMSGYYKLYRAGRLYAIRRDEKIEERRAG